MSVGRLSKWYFLDPSIIIENKLFIGMIPEAATEKELLVLLKNYGTIKEFSIIKLGDRHCKGYGFCHFEKRQDAINAIKSLNGKTFLHV